MVQKVTIDGVNINYTDYGSGTPVLCIHGNPGSLEDFSGMVHENRFRIIAIDRPGHGLSDRYESKTGHLKKQTIIINKFAEKLGLKKFSVAGHSWGAFLALNYAMEFPETLVSIILIAPIAFPRETVSSSTSTLIRLMQNKFLGRPFTSFIASTAGKKAVLSAMENGFMPEEMPEDYRKNSLPGFTLPGQFKSMCEDKADFEFMVMEKCRQYKSIKLPVQIICGAKDCVALNSEQAIPLSESIENSEIVELKNMGHQIPQQNKSILIDRLQHLTA